MSAPTSPLADLFPDGDYRFHLTLRRGEVADFFRQRDSSGTMLAERAHWLNESPRRYTALLPAGEALLDEFSELAANWNGSGAENVSRAACFNAPPGQEKLLTLGASLEPDFVLIAPDATGVFRLVAGVVAFPSGWALEEKVGHPLDFIHSVVPGLNSALASPIQQFLSRIKPGPAFLRSNWGLAATRELSLHPARHLAPPSLPARLDGLWLRVEEQALVALPRTGGVLFGIRIERYRLDDVVQDADAARGLRRALKSMPEPMAAYKGLASIRGPLVDLLKEF